MKAAAQRNGSTRAEDIAVDRAILRLRRRDGRITEESIAGRVNLSRAAVHERLHRLEERGAIRGYRAIDDWSALGLPVSAFVWIRTTPRMDFDRTAAALLCLSIQDAVVDACHRVTGQWTIHSAVHAASVQALQALTDRIGRVVGVEQTMTEMVLMSVYPQTEDDSESDSRT